MGNKQVAKAEKRNKNNKQLKKAEQQIKKAANTMTFGKALNQIEKGLNAQLNDAGLNAKLTQDLKDILKQGKNAAAQEIRDAGFKTNANIAKTARKEINSRKAGVEQQILDKQQELNKMANDAVNNM